MPPTRMMKKGVYFLPNLLTAFNLICGILAVILTLEYLSQGIWGKNGNLYNAPAWLILAAMVFDFLDGKVARWVHAESDFGVKIDSLTDFMSFGVAPVVLAYAVILRDVAPVLQLLACGIFLFAGGWRLARFNTAAAEDAGQTYFQGLPIPAAAAFIASLVLISPETDVMPVVLGRSLSSIPSAIWGLMGVALLLGLAFLMVSLIPFPAFKKVDRRNLILFGGIGIFFSVLMLIFPAQNIMFTIMMLYILSGLFQHFVQRVLRLQNRRRQGR